MDQNRIVYFILFLLLYQYGFSQEKPDLRSLNFAGIEAKVMSYKTMWSAGILASYQPGPVDQHEFIQFQGSDILEFIYETPTTLERLQENAGGFLVSEMPPSLDWERESSSIYAVQLEQRFSPKWALVEQYGIVESSASGTFEMEFQDFEDLSAPPFAVTADASAEINGWQVGVGIRRYFRGVIEPFIQLMPFYRTLKTEPIMVDAIGVSFSPEEEEYDTNVIGATLQVGVHIPVSDFLYVDMFGGISYEKPDIGDAGTPIYIGAGLFLLF